MNIPVAYTGVTLTELPEKIAVYFVLGDCHQHCPGCHSPELGEPIKSPWTMTELCSYAANQISKGANAILLMGGTTNNIRKDDLILLINLLAAIAPVGLYSGSDDDDLHYEIANHAHLTWLKTGSYQKEKGNLESPTTNQRFYRKEIAYCGRNSFDIQRTTRLIDQTYLFQKRKDEQSCSN